ncbi:MAG: hypothetical protein ABEI27_09960 [Halobellus sp.]|uniref:hypothetical protein n=1 Tax=Halobellus sp. TaxID=1979212 RepID=UPI0035D4124D
MEASEITVVSVNGRLAFYPGAEDVQDIAGQSDVPNDFTDRAEVVTTLDGFVDDIEESVERYDESSGVLLWEAPY